MTDTLSSPGESDGHPNNPPLNPPLEGNTINKMVADEYMSSLLAEKMLRKHLTAQAEEPLASWAVEELSVPVEEPTLPVEVAFPLMEGAGLIGRLSLLVEGALVMVEEAVLMGSHCMVKVCFAGTASSGSAEALRFLPAGWLSSACGPSGAGSIFPDGEAFPLGVALSLMPLACWASVAYAAPQATCAPLQKSVSKYSG